MLLTRNHYVDLGFKILQCLGLLCLLQLTACKRYHYKPEPPTLPCRVAGACDVTINKYLVAFNKRGIKVISMGQDYLISIPARALFANQSPRLQWGSYGLLNQVVIFLKQFRKVAIHVTSYSSPYVSPRRAYALTLARSRVVGEYLWSQGIDSRFIFTEGKGCSKPIVGRRAGGDRSPNARVEIIFRRAII